MYSVEKTAPVPSKGKGKVGAPEKAPQISQSVQATRCRMEPQVSRAEAVGRVHLLDVRIRESSMDSLRAKLLRKIMVEDEKLTSKSKIDLVRFPPCHSALKPHLQRLNHHVA